MKMRNMLWLLLIPIYGCSAQQTTEKPKTPQCLSLCANQFAACTEEFPGDFSACSRERNGCDATCRGDRAMESMEKGGGEVFTPIDTPDSGPSVAPESDEQPE